jgi:hypothetical protein
LGTGGKRGDGAMIAAQAILDRGYGKPVQSIDANITKKSIRFVELPMKSASSEPWLNDMTTSSIRRSQIPP